MYQFLVDLFHEKDLKVFGRYNLNDKSNVELGFLSLIVMAAKHSLFSNWASHNNYRHYTIIGTASNTHLYCALLTSFLLGNADRYSGLFMCTDLRLTEITLDGKCRMYYYQRSSATYLGTFASHVLRRGRKLQSSLVVLSHHWFIFISSIVKDQCQQFLHNEKSKFYYKWLVLFPRSIHFFEYVM